ncbi:MAG: agmatinase [Rhodothermia bacterium]|nr:MAG: agmatinase [Rhodothermia bacterium]
MNFDTLELGEIALLGIPFDDHSSFLKGAAKAPERIRLALHSKSANLCSENGLDLSGSSRWSDLGDLDNLKGDEPFLKIEEAIERIVDQGARPLSLGGDHSISYPIVRGVAAARQELTILHLDAHPDLYDEFDGNKLSHACPFARIMEDGLVSRLVQVGIRAMNRHQKEQADRFGIEVLTAREWNSAAELRLTGPLYISLDMDVFDPAFAPGVSHPEPGGLSSRDVFGILQSIEAHVVGADIVELNPDRDPSDITAMLAAKLLKELLAIMHDGPTDARSNDA